MDTHDLPGDADPDNAALLLDRREFCACVLAGGAAMTAVPARAAAAPVRFYPPQARIPLRVNVNGKMVSAHVDARTSCLDLLREQLALTGAKKGCDHGQCGACTVLLDGRRVVSCLTPALQLEGRRLDTIEGLAGPGGQLHPMQQAFIDHDALQCGYCTPGQIMAAVACVREGNASSPDRIREYMSSNLCRCGAYAGIVAAVEQGAAAMERG